MAKQHNPKRKWLKNNYATYRMTNFASGIRACYLYDTRVKNIVDSLDEGFEMCLGVLPSHKSIIIEKKGNKLSCRLEENYTLVNGVYLYFKNIESAILVLTNKLSFAKAFAQGRFTLVGETRMAINFINILNILQIYFSSYYKRKKYLDNNITKQVKASKIVGFIYFRGWL